MRSCARLPQADRMMLLPDYGPTFSEWRSTQGADPQTETNAPVLTLLVLKTLEVDRLLAFYQTLGFRFVEEQHGKGPVHYSATIGAMVFEIYPAAAVESVDSATRLGFEMANLAETVESLRSAGTPIISEPKETRWGARAVVRDPDGRAVELYQRP